MVYVRDVNPLPPSPVPPVGKPPERKNLPPRDRKSDKDSNGNCPQDTDDDARIDEYA